MQQSLWSRIVKEVAGIARNIRRDTAGNTLAIMAAALIPLAAFSGSAIDMARLYVVKVRLQQACDAGALAGRRALQDLSPSTGIDSTAQTAANKFFDNNFKSGWFNNTLVSRVYKKDVDPQDTTTADIVEGNVQATVPMAVMAMFGVTTKTINVTCQAKYDVPDLDVMFVLDTTGSMSCLPSDSESTCNSYAASNVKSDSAGYYVTEKGSSRIAGLRSAVLSFFDTVTTQASAVTNFRFGFVPYSATVNVGALLTPLNYVWKGNWTYQSRSWDGNDSVQGTANTTLSASSSSACSALNNVRSPATGYSSAGTATKNINVSWSSSTSKCTGTVQTLYPEWVYQPVAYDTTNFVGSLAGSAIDNPAQMGSATTKWAGCIEERDTTTGMSSAATSAPSGDYDLDVDTVPSDIHTSWKPLWNDVEFDRLKSGEVSGVPRTVTARNYGGKITETAATLLNEIPCPAAASAIDQMTLAAGASASTKSSLRTTLSNYMLASNGFRPYGVTYHDVGMTWGTRLLTPALFPVAKKPWTDGNELERYIIFMTDGAMEVDQAAYASHGMEEYDQRVTGGSLGSLTTYHVNRFQTACAIAKSHNIHVFLIAFASSISTADFNTMKGCATTPSDAYQATDTAGLTAAFTQIAKKIGSLRINK